MSATSTEGKTKLPPGKLITREYWDEMRTRPKLTGASHATIHGFSTWLDKPVERWLDRPVYDTETAGHRQARKEAETKAERQAKKDAVREGRPRALHRLPFQDKSLFYMNALVQTLVDDAYTRLGRVAENGRIVYKFELDFVVGYDAKLKCDTRHATLIVDADGVVTTAYPGMPPSEYPKGLFPSEGE